MFFFFFFFSSRRRHTRWPRDWSSDVCSSDLRPLITFVEVAAGGIGLPDPQEGVRQRFATVVEYAAGHNVALADRLATGPRIARQVCVFRCDSTDGGSRPRQLREGQWHIDEREQRSASPRGLISLIQVGREDLPVASD